MKNQRLSKRQLAIIRALNDFDLTMLISEIHDHGWPIASKTLEIILEAREIERKINSAS